MAGRLQGRGRHQGIARRASSSPVLCRSAAVAGGTEFVFSPVVAMNDVLGVRGGKDTGELPADGEGLVLAQSATALLQSL